MNYVAFLRGINVGGHTVKMTELIQIFTILGFVNVKTVIASGNVVFETSEKSEKMLTEKIEEQLKKTLGFEVAVMIRSIPEVKRLVNSDPFKDISVTPQTRLYITFLASIPDESLRIAYSSPDNLVKLLKVTDTEVCSVIAITPTKNTTDLMTDLEKKFGKKVTTRNWNTILKIAALFE